MRAQRLRTLVGSSVVLVVVGSAAALVWFLVTLRETGDYSNSMPGSDNAAPLIAALVHLRFAHLPAVQTVMGLTSLLWRAPFVAPVLLSGGDTLQTYAVGAAACTLPVVLLVVWLVARDVSARQIAAAALAALLMILGPPSVNAIQAGHPEEFLTAVLGVAAVIAAQAGRRTTAALLLGLAIGAKESALLATPAVLIALPGGRRRAAVIAFAVGALLTAPLPLLDLAAFHRADAHIGTVYGLSSLSLWRPVGLLSGHSLPFGLHRGDAAFGSVVGLIVFLGPLGRWLRGHATDPETIRVDPMALLALIGVLRCICDPGCLLYYLVGAVIPIAVWEVGTLRRLPVVTTVLCGLISLCFTGTLPFGATPPELGGSAGIDVFLAASAVLALYLAIRTFVPPGLRAGQAAIDPSPQPGLVHST